MVEPVNLRRHDFTFLKLIGSGAYSRVFKALKNSTDEIFAIKIEEKAFLQKVKFTQEHKEHTAFVERDILNKFRDYPQIITLHSSFHDDFYLYFVLDFCQNSDLLSLIHQLGKFPIELTKQYTAEIVNILEFIHSNGVIHRDIKPENFLLDEDNHLKLSDFGGSKHADFSSDSSSCKSTFVGSAYYVSPEMLEDLEISIGVDLWALGCVVYYMLVGEPPFTGVTNYLIFEEIKQREIYYPEWLDSESVDLIEKLLKTEPSERLGAGEAGSDTDYFSLKAHPFFAGCDFFNLLTQKIEVYPKSRTFSESEREILDLNTVHYKILISGEIKKKKGAMCKKKLTLWYQKRVLYVTDLPSIYYTNTQNDLRGRIEITRRLRAFMINEKKFGIRTHNRTYYWKHPESEKWVDCINQMIIDRFPGLEIKINGNSLDWKDYAIVSEVPFGVWKLRFTEISEESFLQTYVRSFLIRHSPYLLEASFDFEIAKGPFRAITLYFRKSE